MSAGHLHDRARSGTPAFDVGIGLRDRERADGRDLLIVEDRLPVDAAVLGLPDAAGGRAAIVGIRVAGDADDGAHTIADRANVAVSETGYEGRVEAALPSRAPDRRIASGDDPNHYGVLLVPTGHGPHPVVVLIHGGCFKAAYATGKCFGAMGDTLKAGGVATWNVEYRRPAA